MVRCEDDIKKHTTEDTMIDMNPTDYSRNDMME